MSPHYPLICVTSVEQSAPNIIGDSIKCDLTPQLVLKFSLPWVLLHREDIFFIKCTPGPWNVLSLVVSFQ